MNVRSAFILLVLSALLSSGCVRPLEWEGSDGPYNAISLALSLRSSGDVSGGPATKMSATITQDGAGFRGIEQVYVIPFQTGLDTVAPGKARLGASNVVIHNPSIDKNGLVPSNNAHLYDLAILPRGMDRVLAYGKSVDDGSVSTLQEKKHKNGVLTPYGLDNPGGSGDITFGLEPILETAAETAVDSITNSLMDALNDVVEAIQESNNADILAFLDVFATENMISACSSQTLLRFEQSLLIAISSYDVSKTITIRSRLSSLRTARNAAGSDFPAKYGIPEGAVGMWWNGHKFVKLLNGVNISLVPTPLYCYPPSLWYYANSAIKTSSNDDIAQYYTSENTTWGNILYWYTEGSSVTVATRSVAIEDQLQYGVGLVEFRLALDASASAAAGYPLTGIIIGEQRDVDFSFSPKSSAESRFIYDNTISGITIDGTPKSVSVLVLPTADGESVHFALEFQNNTASALQCQQLTVLPGCKFYLAGELKLPEGSVGSVFSRDCKTTVNVTVRDLVKAYNTVPDLRDPKLEIGVDTEMDWIQVEPGGIKLPY